MLQCGFVRSNFSLAIAKTPDWPGSVQRMGVMLIKNLERVDGIEPTSSAWKAAALPLCYTRAKNAGAHKGQPHPAALVIQDQPSQEARGGGSRTRTCEAYAGDLQSPPFAARDIPPRASRNRRNRFIHDHSDEGETKAFGLSHRLV